jgi:hypothetical protein
MGHWNYRVLRHTDGSIAIHEVHYDDSGKPHACTEEPTGFAGDSLEELRSELALAERGLQEKILDYESFNSKTGVNGT